MIDVVRFPVKRFDRPSARRMVLKPVALRIGCCVLWLSLLLLSSVNAAEPNQSRRRASRDATALLQSTKMVRELAEAELIKMVPAQSGLHYVDCPNCSRGRQENQLTWSPDRPDELTCQFCDHKYPSDQYPMSQNVTVKSPLGELVHFPYWADASGYRHFFQAKRDDKVREFLAQQARDLAALYVETNDKSYARRAALIVDRFAQVFPNWCYHYDYPFRQKEIYDGAILPSQYRSGFRTARWTWWAYSDIPTPLIQAYEGIRDSGALEDLSKERGMDVAARIEKDLIRNACDQVLANPDLLTNMSPTAWRSLIAAGKAIREPNYVHEPVRRLRRFAESQFFYDGMWSEGSPDYGSQSVGGLDQVLQALDGYSDPPGYVDSIDGTRFDSIKMSTSFPVLNQARDVLSKLRLPNGRPVPIHDTWSTSQRGKTGKTEPYLLPAVGHACLGGGTAEEQTQFHLAWSGGYGHSHGDNLSLMLFANGQEVLSDIGYTHTAYRAWTLATAAHNTVVIDGKNQELGGIDAPTDGNLEFYDSMDQRVQIVRATGQRAYPNLARTYVRTLVVVKIGEGRYYAVDVFDVEGGKTHDYFLHGDADREAIVRSDLSLMPLPTLLPKDFQWTPTVNEGETSRIRTPYYAYGYFRGLKSAPVSANAKVPITFGSADREGANLRVTLLPESDAQLVLGTNPSIRQAGEDDAKLEQFQRPFMMLRNQAKNGRSRFVAILEPHADAPSILSIRRLPTANGAVAIEVQIEDRTDFIVLSNSSESVSIQAGKEKAEFTGSFGVLSVRNSSDEGDPEYAYAVGKGGWHRDAFQLQSNASYHADLLGIDPGFLVVDGGNAVAPKAGSVVRVVTSDGWVYPFTVKSSMHEGGRIRIGVVESTAMRFDLPNNKLQLLSFPQREHSGSIGVQWFATSSLSKP
jgi:hypothetical protein